MTSKEQGTTKGEGIVWRQIIQDSSQGIQNKEQRREKGMSGGSSFRVQARNTEHGILK